MNDQAPKELQPSESDMPKQAYECPAIIYRAPLETTAGECSTRPPGKTGTPQDPCSVTVS